MSCGQPAAGAVIKASLEPPDHLLVQWARLLPLRWRNLNASTRMPDESFALDTGVVVEDLRGAVSQLSRALSGADELYLPSNLASLRASAGNLLR